MDLKEYEFIWRDGTKNLAQGEAAEQALTNAGFGAGALPALDYWRECSPLSDTTLDRRDEHG